MTVKAPKHSGTTPHPDSIITTIANFCRGCEPLSLSPGGEIVVQQHDAQFVARATSSGEIAATFSKMPAFSPCGRFLIGCNAEVELHDVNYLVDGAGQHHQNRPTPLCRVRLQDAAVAWASDGMFYVASGNSLYLGTVGQSHGGTFGLTLNSVSRVVGGKRVVAYGTHAVVDGEIFSRTGKIGNVQKIDSEYPAPVAPGVWLTPRGTRLVNSRGETLANLLQGARLESVLVYSPHLCDRAQRDIMRALLPEATWSERGIALRTSHGTLHFLAPLVAKLLPRAMRPSYTASVTAADLTWDIAGNEKVVCHPDTPLPATKKPVPIVESRGEPIVPKILKTEPWAPGFE